MKPTSAQLNLAREFADRKNSLKAAQWALDFMGATTHGIESVDCADRTARYVNLGDTYDQTIIAERTSRTEFVVQSWGDWLESATSEHETGTETIKCGYCSAFTPRKADEFSDWHDVECESCGHRVGG